MRGGAEAQPFPKYPSDGKLRSKWPRMPENDYYWIYTSCFRECVVCLYSKSDTFIMVFYKRYIAIGSGEFQRKLAPYDEMGRFEFGKAGMSLGNPDDKDHEIDFYSTQKKTRFDRFKEFLSGKNMDSLPKFTIRGTLQVNKLMYGAPREPIETCIDFFPAPYITGYTDGYKGYIDLRRKLFDLIYGDQVLALSNALLDHTFSSVPAEIFHRIAHERRVALCQVCCDPYQVEVSEQRQAVKDTGEAAEDTEEAAEHTGEDAEDTGEAAEHTGEDAEDTEEAAEAK